MLADLKLNRLLGNIDDWIEQQGLAAGVGPVERPAATNTDSVPITDIDLASGEVKTVIWATGFRPDYSWLRVPVLDRKGWLQHDGGVVAAPGLYAMGLPFMRRRKSSFIFGAGDDAGAICHHLENYLRACRQRAVFEVA